MALTPQQMDQKIAEHFAYEQQAAGRLMQQGRKPTMGEVAAEALAPARHRFRDASYPRARLPGGAVGNAPASRAR